MTLAGTIASCSPSHRRDQNYGSDAYTTYTPPEPRDAAPQENDDASPGNDGPDAGVTDARDAAAERRD